MRRETLRSVSTIVLCVIVIAGSGVIVRADDWSSFCGYWSQWHHTDPGDSVGCFNGSEEWSWWGQYDFSSMGENDALNTAAALCDDEINACYSECNSSDYIAWAQEQDYYQSYEEYGYYCWYDASCYDTVGYPTCEQSTTGSFDCSCDYTNVCLGCE